MVSTLTLDEHTQRFVGKFAAVSEMRDLSRAGNPR